MRILINTASTFTGGSVQVAKSLIEELAELPHHDYGIIASQAVAKLVDTKNFPSNFSFYFINYRPATRVFSWKSRTAFFEEVEKVFKPDIVLTTSGPAYWRPQSRHIMGFNLAHHLYPESQFFDIINWRDRLFWSLKKAVIHYYFKRDADAYVVQTQDIKLRLKRWLKTDAVFTVSNTYASIYQQKERWQPVQLESRCNHKRVLVLSAYYKHKNLEIINSIAERLHEKNESLRFVVTLPDQVAKHIFSETALRYIENVGPVTPEQCPSLYQQCNVVFLPTLLECFSANYAEAMAMEKPIITSDLGFAHTVCGEAAAYVDPTNADEILETINKVLSDDALSESLISKGREQVKNFKSAKERAFQYLELCKKLYAEK